MLNLEHRRTRSEFLEDFPGVTRADAILALKEVRTSLTATLKLGYSGAGVCPEW